MVVFPLTENKKPAVPAGTDWRDYKGPAKSDIVGVMVPDGVVVLDIDTYKGATTEQVEQALGGVLPWADAELQITLHGGRHYAFRLPGRFDITNGQNVLGVKGFDTRSSGKGYIATGKGYTNLTFIESVIVALHDIEFWPLLPIEAAIKLSVNQDVEEPSDLEQMVRDQPLDLSFDDVLGYMERLPADCAEDGDKWLRVMMGLYHQFQGSEKGWEVFNTFSQLCPEKYDERKNRNRWDSLGKRKATNPVTFATVIDYAGGRDVVAQDQLQSCLAALKLAQTKDAVSDLVKQAAAFRLDGLNEALLLSSVKDSFKRVTGGKLTDSQIKAALRKHRPQKEGDYYQDFVFLTATGEYMNRETKVTMGPRPFDVRYSRDTPGDADGNPQRATSYVDNRIDCVHAGMYAPMFGDFFTYDGVDYFNTYKPNPLERKPAGEVVEKVKGHIAHLLPDPFEQQLVINYLAHNVQRPGVKMFWAMVLQGVQGDGKSFFAEMMQHVLGRSNCKVVSAEVLDERYTSWAEESCMTFFEEVKVDNYRKYEILNKLKPFITNPVISVRKMYRDTYEAINTTNYFALTNFKDCLPIDDNDRRYCVVFSQWQGADALERFMAENPGYYPDLYDSMRKGVGEILDWLLTHPIPDSFLSLKRAPMTRAKEMMQEMARSDDWLIVEDALAKFKTGDINDFVVNVTKLQTLVDDTLDAEFKDFPKTSRLKNILLDMGYHSIGRYKDKDRKNQRIYCKDDQAKAADFAFGF